jgi:hypothetical protein
MGDDGAATAGGDARDDADAITGRHASHDAAGAVADGVAKEGGGATAGEPTLAAPASKEGVEAGPAAGCAIVGGDADAEGEEVLGARAMSGESVVGGI